MSDALFARLRERRASIASLDVTHVDDRAQTQQPITPALLATWPSAMHHHSSDATTIAKAVALVEALRPTATHADFDVRWKLAFLDGHGHEIFAVFHESFEPYGYIGHERVKFKNDALLHFLRATFGVHEKTLDRL